MDPITETIAHFVGFFEMAVEEARGRLDYDEFRALKAKAEKDAELRSVDYHGDASFQLTDVDPDLRYIPFDHAVVPLTAANQVQGQYSPPASADIGPSSAPDPFLRFDGYLFPMRLKTEYILTPPGQTAVVVKQTNFLTDNDYLNMSNVDVDMTPVAYFENGLGVLAGEADALDPIGELTKPATEAAIGTLVQDIARIVSDDLGDGPAATGPANIFVAKGSAVSGIHSNGALVDEAPALSDYLPEDEEEEENEPVSFVAGEGDVDIAAHVDLDTGSNLLVNEALIANNWIVSPVIAVGGDAIDINLISQINVWSDIDSIGTEFANWIATDSQSTAAFNIASVTRDITTPQDTGDTDASSMFPTQWTVTRLDGNLVFLDWIEQLSVVSDHDTTVMTKVGSETMVQMGGNTMINAFSLLQMGQYFDLVVAGGGFYHANIISQTNILLDNDFMWAENGFSSSGSASLSTGGNLLWNQASIHTVGQTKFMGMPDHYMQAVNGLGGGSDDLPGAVLSDSAFAGLGALNVLYIGGSIFDFQYISQTNILGDSDQIAMFEESLGDDGTDNGWTITTGSNHLINIASIVDSGVDGTVYAGGEIYSDALLYQAELISDDPLGTLGDPSDLASEAVVFLADDMLEPDLGDDEGGAIGADAPEAVHVDVMQTMLA